MGEGREQWRELRGRLADLLADEGDSTLRDDEEMQGRVLIPIDQVKVCILGIKYHKN